MLSSLKSSSRSSAQLFLLASPLASPRRGWTLAVILTLVLLILFLISLYRGSVALTWQEWWQAVLGTGDPTYRAIIWELRLPRILLGVMVGAALGMPGALLQGMLGNGLADPHLQ